MPLHNDDIELLKAPQARSITSADDARLLQRSGNLFYRITPMKDRGIRLIRRFRPIAVLDAQPIEGRPIRA